MQVGSYFAGQYYQVLQQKPDLVHRFYSDASAMIRIDGDSIESASEIMVKCFFLCNVFMWIMTMMPGFFFFLNK